MNFRWEGGAHDDATNHEASAGEEVGPPRPGEGEDEGCVRGEEDEDEGSEEDSDLPRGAKGSVERRACHVPPREVW